MAITSYKGPNHSFRPVKGTEIEISRSTQINDLASVDTAEKHTPIPTTPRPTVTNWDEIDPVTGLSKEYMTAMDIIDSCDYAELRRFNAPLLVNQTSSIGQQIEMYYNGGESEEHRRKRKGKMVMGREEGVVEKVAAIMAFWRRARPKKAVRGG